MCPSQLLIWRSTTLPTETVTRAAIRVRGTVYSVPAPGRHHDVILHMRNDVGISAPQDESWEQGFVTSAGRFVDRYEGRKLAEQAGQLLPRAYDVPQLFSEVVW